MGWAAGSGSQRPLCTPPQRGGESAANRGEGGGGGRGRGRRGRGRRGEWEREERLNTAVAYTRSRREGGREVGREREGGRGREREGGREGRGNS